MSISYGITTNFGAKDALPANDPDKIIFGAEFTQEFTAIQSAFTLAAPTASPTFTGTATFNNATLNGTTTAATVDINGGAIDGTTVGATTPAAGSFTALSATGNITVGGTVDGRDVAADGAKLDGIEAGADVTDTANVTAAGALMDSELTNIAAVKGLNQGVATTDSPTFAGASFSGDLAVDTDTLFVDVSAGRVGIGTTAPNDTLEVRQDQNGETEIAVNNFDTGANASANLLLQTDGNNFRIKNFGDGTSTPNLTEFLSTAGGSAFAFSPSNSEGMRIDNNGNVGIGTSSPATNLHVSDATEAQIYLSDTGGAGATSANSQLIFTHGAGNTNNAYIGNDQNVVTGAFSMGTLVNYPMSFVINSSEVMRIETSGNVGIGTDSPSDLLHIEAATPIVRLSETDDTAYSRIFQSAGDVFIASDVGNDGGSSIIFRNGGTTERARIDASGNVGIGTSSPAADLEVSSDANTKVRVSDSTNVNQRFEISHNAGFTALTAGNNAAKGVLAFYQYDGTDTTEAMRLDSSGNLATSFDLSVGVGSTSSLFIKKSFDTTAALKFQRTTAGTPVDASVSCDVNENLVFDWNLDGLNAACLFNSNGNERFRIENSGKVGIGVSTALGGILTLPHQESISFHDAGGSARKVLEFDTGELKHGSAGAGLSTQTFFTSGTERARIDNTGGLTVGHTDQIAFNENTNTGTTILNNGAITTFRDAATANMYVGKIGALDGDVLEFRRNGIDVGSISVTSGATAYNTSSDVRLKENITDAPEGNVDVLQVRSFDWKVDGSHQEYGFIAQELEAVAPYAVTKGETEDDMWGVDYSKLVPMLVKELQDAKARIVALEAGHAL